MWKEFFNGFSFYLGLSYIEYNRIEDKRKIFCVYLKWFKILVIWFVKFFIVRRGWLFGILVVLFCMYGFILRIIMGKNKKYNNLGFFRVRDFFSIFDK